MARLDADPTSGKTNHEPTYSTRHVHILETPGGHPNVRDDLDQNLEAVELSIELALRLMFLAMLCEVVHNQPVFPKLRRFLECLKLVQSLGCVPESLLTLHLRIVKYVEEPTYFY